MRSNRPSAIALRIEELILPDLPARQRHQLGALIEQELARLLAEQGTPNGLVAGSARLLLDGVDVTVAHGASAEAIGAQVAQAIYSRLVTGSALGSRAGRSEL